MSLKALGTFWHFCWPAVHLFLGSHYLVIFHLARPPTSSRLVAIWSQVNLINVLSLAFLISKIRKGNNNSNSYWGDFGVVAVRLHWDNTWQRVNGLRSWSLVVVLSLATCSSGILPRTSPLPSEGVSFSALHFALLNIIILLHLA